MMYKFTYCKNFASAETKEVEWDDFSAVVSKSVGYDTKEESIRRAAIVGGVRSDESVGRAENIGSRTMASLDYDDMPAGTTLDDVELALAMGLGCGFVAYTTFRHTPEAPRFRVFAPLSRSVTPAEYPAIVGMIKDQIGLDGLDKCSYTVNQIMFLASHKHGVEPWRLLQGGEPWPVPDVIAGMVSGGYTDAPDDLDVAVAAQPLDITDDQMTALLDSYHADPLEYDDWLRVGMAIWHQTKGNGYATWCAWSEKSTKHDERQMRVKWRSFGGHASPVTMASVIAAAGGMSVIRQALGNEPKSTFNAPDDFTAWQPLDRSTLTPVQFVYGDFYARGYTSLTVAPPKVGKSLLLLTEAVDAAAGAGILAKVGAAPYRDEPLPKRRVLYYSAEDDLSTIQTRVLAIIDEHGIDGNDLMGNLFVVSGIARDDFFLAEGDALKLNESLFDWLTDFIRQNEIDLAIFDPLQDMTRSPETNEVFRALGQRLRRLASQTSVSIGLVHHTRKMLPGVKATIDDARGGSALRGTSRFNRILVPMTEDEGAKAGVKDHRDYFRIGETESNLAPPSSSRNQWFQKSGVQVTEDISAPAILKWSWPDPMSGVPSDAAKTARRLVIEATEAGNPLRANMQAKEWGGHAIGKELGIDTADKRGKAKMNGILKKWIDEEHIRIDQSEPCEKGKTHPILVAVQIDAAELEADFVWKSPPLTPTYPPP